MSKLLVKLTCLWDKEIDLLISKTNETPLEPFDIISDHRSVEALCLLYSSMVSLVFLVLNQALKKISNGLLPVLASSVISPIRNPQIEIPHDPLKQGVGRPLHPRLRKNPPFRSISL